MKKIYIAGAGGMLGDAFYKNFSGNYDVRCSDIDLNSRWLSKVDFRILEEYREDVINFKPDYLFHIGAHTNLEYCERHVEDAYLTNVTSVENAVYIANSLGIPLLYIGTAGIFDGEKDFYDDWDLPNPLGVYARTKYIGELIVRENIKNHLICRAGWMMGGGEKKDKKFINKIFSQIKSGHKKIYIVNDKFGTPTYTHDFANNVKKLLESQLWGLYNMVCEGMTSRMEVATELVKIMGLQNVVEIVEVDSSYFRNEYFAERPNSEVLINTKLNLRGVNSMRDWRVALKDYVDNEYEF